MDFSVSKRLVVLSDKTIPNRLGANSGSRCIMQYSGEKKLNMLIAS